MKEWFKKALSYGFILGIMLFVAYLFSRKELLLVIAVILVMTLSIVFAIARAVTKKRPDKAARKAARNVRPEKDLLDP